MVWEKENVQGTILQYYSCRIGVGCVCFFFVFLLLIVLIRHALVVVTYIINLSHSAQMFCPGGNPPVVGGAGLVSGA